MNVPALHELAFYMRRAVKERIMTEPGTFIGTQLRDLRNEGPTSALSGTNMTPFALAFGDGSMSHDQDDVLRVGDIVELSGGIPKLN